MATLLDEIRLARKLKVSKVIALAGAYSDIGLCLVNCFFLSMAVATVAAGCLAVGLSAMLYYNLIEPREDRHHV